MLSDSELQLSQSEIHQMKQQSHGKLIQILQIQVDISSNKIDEINYKIILQQSQQEREERWSNFEKDRTPTYIKHQYLKDQMNVNAPINYREQPLTSESICNQEIEIRPQFENLRNQLKNEMSQLLQQSQNINNKDIKKFKFGIFREYSVENQQEFQQQQQQQEKEKIIQKSQPIQQEQQSIPTKYDFKLINQQRQVNIGFAEKNHNQHNFNNLPRDINNIFNLEDQGDDPNIVNYQQALGLLQIVEDLKENKQDNLKRQQLDILQDDIIESQVQQNVQLYRDLAPVSRNKTPERTVLLHKEEVEIDPENPTYKDIVNLLSDRMSPKNLRHLFPQKEVPIPVPYIKSQSIQSGQIILEKESIHQGIQTENYIDYPSFNQKQEKQEEVLSSESDNPPKNLGKIQSLKQKLFVKHDKHWDRYTRFEQVQIEIGNVKKIKQEITTKTTYLDAFKVRQELNQVILSYLEELHEMILESDPELEEYFGIFPDGLNKISEYVHLLKGKKTKENISCGKVMERILLEYKEIMQEYKQDQTIQHDYVNQLQQMKIEEEKKKQDKCHDYDAARKHRELHKKREEYKNKTKNKSQQQTKVTIKQEKQQNPPLSQEKTQKKLQILPSQQSTRRKIPPPQKKIPLKEGFAKQLLNYYLNILIGWFGASYNESDFQ